MSDARDRAIDLIRKLLALEKGNDTGEAAVAAAAAARLMVKYQVESVELEEDDPDLVGDNRDLYVEIGKSKRPDAWKWNLAWGVAASAQCKPYTLHRKADGKILGVLVAFIGRRADAEMCVVIYEHLLEAVTRLHDARRPSVGRRVQQYVPGVPAAPVDRDFQRRWSQDFYSGAVAMVSQRMWEAREEVISTVQDEADAHAAAAHAADEHDHSNRSTDAAHEAPRCTALQRLDMIAYDVDQAAADLGLDYVKAPAMQIRTAQGYAAGVAAGREVGLSPDAQPNEDLAQLRPGSEKP